MNNYSNEKIFLEIDSPFGKVISITGYASFVEETDVSKHNPDYRFDIALYGLVGEIGSLVSAIKKRLISGKAKSWALPNEEIIEELGDCLWYCFAIGAASGHGSAFVAEDIKLLQREVGGIGQRSDRIRQVLKINAEKFLSEAPSFLKKLQEGSATLEDFQAIAFLTSRTENDQLVEVCLAVLQQLTAELLRNKLPDLEKELNSNLPDRKLQQILAEVLWHLAALASLYQLNLGAVAEKNIAKLNRRFRRDKTSPLPDEGNPGHEQFPRRFDIAFVTVAKGRSRMYLNGKRLGDDLTDNSYEEDGYRFHDVMHLALVAKLGWSPVLRRLMRRKRKSDPKVDEVEDGARASIVEEAVINAIYAEGRQIAESELRSPESSSARLFANASDVSFTFLKRIESLVTGLEVDRSAYWEWEDAILSGFEIFNELRVAGRGTVSIDLKQRSLLFSPSVFLNISGNVAGLGTYRVKKPYSASISNFDEHERQVASRHGAVAVSAHKEALRIALGIPEVSDQTIRINGWRDGLVDVLATGLAQSVMWDKRIVAFRASSIEDDDSYSVTIIALSDE